MAITDEQIKMLCNAIRNAISFHNADTFEHVFGPRDSPEGAASALHRIASANGQIADAISEVASALNLIADVLADGVLGNRAARGRGTAKGD